MRTLVFTADHSATTELTAMTLDVQEHSTVTIRCLCDRGGSLKTKYVFDSGKVADDQSLTVAAASLSSGVYSNLTTAVFDYKVGKIQITFTPADGTSGFTEIEVTTARK